MAHGNNPRTVARLMRAFAAGTGRPAAERAAFEQAAILLEEQDVLITEQHEIILQFMEVLAVIFVRAFPDDNGEGAVH